MIGGGVAFHRNACALGLEGIVSKRLGTRYRGGRNLDWQKAKCVRRQEFVIGGFTDPEGAREAIGALLIGYYEGGTLRWAGKVGTGAGWNAAYLKDLRRRLDAHRGQAVAVRPARRRFVAAPQRALGAPAAGRGDRVRRMDGRRSDPPPVDAGAARRQGLRATCAASSRRRPTRPRRRSRPNARRAKAKKPARAATPDVTNGPVVRGIAVSHPDRVIYADLALTKLDVARYYGEVAPAMVPHVAGRPLTLLRCGGAIDYGAEKGGCVMLRHGKAWGPRELRRVKIRELQKTGEYLVADTPEALVALAQMGVVEVHTWNAAAETPYQHDRVVFDFDPGPQVAWREVVAAARAVRQMLADQKLRAWVKTTGGKGLHVVVPIAPADGAACLTFAQAVSAALADSAPDAIHDDHRQQGGARAANPDRRASQRPREHRRRRLLAARAAGRARVRAAGLGRADPSFEPGALHDPHRDRPRARSRPLARLLEGSPEAADPLTTAARRRERWELAPGGRAPSGGDP